MSHSGKVYTCRKCGKSFNRRDKFQQHLNKVVVKDRKLHEPYFKKEIDQNCQTFGRVFDRHETPYGCPVGHSGIKRGDEESSVDTEETKSQPGCRKSHVSRPQFNPSSQKIISPSIISIVSTNTLDTTAPHENLETTAPQGNLETTASASHVEKDAVELETHVDPIRKSSRVVYKEGQYKDMFQEEDYDSDSDNSDCWKKSEDSEEEEEMSDDEELVNTIRANGDEQCAIRKENNCPPDLSDNEDEDSPEIDAARRQKHLALKRIIGEKLEEPSSTNFLNEEDQALILKHIKKPLILNCSLFTNLIADIPEEIVEKVQNNLELKGSEKKFIAKTAGDLAYAFRSVLRLIDEDTRTNAEHLLSEDGHIHVNQFFCFMSDKFIKPFNIRPLLEASQATGSSKIKMLDSYSGFLKQIFKAVGSQEGFAQFYKYYDEAEPTWSTAKKNYKAEKAQDRLQAKILNIEKEIKIDKPYQKWHGERMNYQKKTEEAEKYFEGLILPDPIVIIGKWLNHPSVMEIERKIVNYAMRKEVVTQEELRQIMNHMILRLSMKIGSRIEIFRYVTWGDYYEGREKGPAVFPHKQVIKSRY